MATFDGLWLIGWYICFWLMLLDYEWKKPGDGRQLIYALTAAVVIWPFILGAEHKTGKDVLV